MIKAALRSTAVQCKLSRIFRNFAPGLNRPAQRKLPSCPNLPQIRQIRARLRDFYIIFRASEETGENWCDFSHAHQTVTPLSVTFKASQSRDISHAQPIKTYCVATGPPLAHSQKVNNHFPHFFVSQTVKQKSQSHESHESDESHKIQHKNQVRITLQN